MTPRFLLTAALILTVLPTFAGTPAKPLTPPEVFGKAKTIQFTATLLKNTHWPGYSDQKAVEVSKAIIVQPNKAYVVDTDAKTRAVDVVYASDGKTQTEYRAVRGHFTKSDAPTRIGDIESSTIALSTLTDFFDPVAFARFQDLGILRLHDYDQDHLYQLSLGKQDGKKVDEFIFVNHKTGLPKYVFISVEGMVPNLEVEGTHLGSQETERIVFSKWKLNAKIDDSKFAYTPPADAKLYVAPKLLANGITAPDFTVQDKDGKAVKLSDYRGKTIVLDFWATWCGPCQSSLPHTTELAKKYAAKNVVVLAVNVLDTTAAFQAWLPKHPEYAALNFAIDTNADQDKSVATALYGVSGIPTQYVIDAQGKIIKSIVGYEPGDTQLEDTLKAMGE